MCCFRLYFSDFNVLFFKKINLLQFTFEKNNFCAKKRKKLVARKSPSPLPPTGYQMVHPLLAIRLECQALKHILYPQAMLCLNYIKNLQLK